MQKRNRGLFENGCTWKDGIRLIPGEGVYKATRITSPKDCLHWGPALHKADEFNVEPWRCQSACSPSGMFGTEGYYLRRYLQVVNLAVGCDKEILIKSTFLK